MGFAGRGAHVAGNESEREEEEEEEEIEVDPGAMPAGVPAAAIT